MTTIIKFVYSTYNNFVLRRQEPIPDDKLSGKVPDSSCRLLSRWRLQCLR